MASPKKKPVAKKSAVKPQPAAKKSGAKKPAAKPAAKKAPAKAKSAVHGAWAEALRVRLRPDPLRRMAELLDRGVERLREGRAIEAIPDLTAVVAIAVAELAPADMGLSSHLAWALYHRARATQDVSPELALRDVEDAVSLFDRQPGIGSDTVASCRLLHGSLLHAMQRLEEAVSELSSAISLLELDKAAKAEFDEAGLNAAYTKRGEAYADLRRVDESIADSTEAIQNFEAAEVQNRPVDRAMYALALRNRGLAYGERKQHGEAIKDLVKAETIIDEVSENTGTKHLEELAFLCHAQARIWENLANERNAMANLDKAILMRERLVSAGRLTHWRMLAEAYEERATFHLKTSPVEAVGDLRRAEEIYVSLGPDVSAALDEVRLELRKLQQQRES